MADTLFKDGFNETGNWEYIADDVMGGVSKGKVQFKTSKLNRTFVSVIPS